MKIWVYLNGIQQGPYTLEELSQLNLSPTTPVWYDGLAQWMPANEAPATAQMFASGSEAAGSPGNVVINLATQDTHTRQAAAAEVKAELPPEPPTFIGWSIFVMLCCFPIGGLLGIILSVISGNAYRAGDYQKARRMSECAEWCVIISIVLGLLTMPLAIILF